MHRREGLDDLFTYTLSQLQSLFPDMKGGIVLVEAAGA
jgi:hypothetical protein